MLKIIFIGGVLHLFFLASMFVIYFQSPIITGLEPQTKVLNPPAKRLVLYVADGLRAESFFREGCANTKFMKDVMLTEGIHGISHTRVPTESRTGHVALIAGMYEDPSALFKGWQENPVDFDSVFNRSDTTYAFGSPDILKIFDKKSNNKNIKLFAYDPTIEDFSGRYSTILLDSWVFDNVEQFLTNHHEELKMKNETVYFLHLLGLDTAGHVHKPNTKLFLDNLISVDQGVERITKLFNKYFQDNQTAFVFTADHGMTDRGSHGDGDEYETQTPIVAWGAGVSKYSEFVKSPGELVSIIGSSTVPRFDIEQIDIAPLMASLLGIPVPVNNYGQLPHEYLNTSKSYIAKAMFNNALQIAAQYKHLRNEFLKGSFSKYLNDYKTFDGTHMSSMEIHINQLLEAEKFDEAINSSKRLIEQSINGVEYFQSYYQYWLLAAVALSMVGWILYLVQAPLRSAGNDTDFQFKINRVHTYIGGFGVFVILMFICFQNLSILNAIILCGPFICWLPVSFSSIQTVVQDARVWIFILAVEFLLWTFFLRPILCVLLVFLPIYFLYYNDNRKQFYSSNFIWIMTSVVLSVFPLMPIVGKSDKNSTEILIFGIILWLMKLSYSLQQTYCFYKMCHLVVFIAASLSLIVVGLGNGLNIICQIVSWMCLMISFILPLLQSTKHRFEAIIDGLSIPFILLSLSYEPIFLLILSLNLEYFVEMHRKKVNQTKDLIHFPQRPEANTYTNAFSFMLYVLLSFFGTGNLASISSFDPNSVRCFVAVFSPILMAVLMILKIVVPLIIVVCAFTAIYASYKLSMEKIFLAILVICNIMGINFLFLVTNKGSWLQIGTSISHFVIIETTTVILCVLQLLAKLLMEVEVNVLWTKRRSTYKFE